MAILADWQSTLESLATAVAALGLIAAAWGVFLARKQIKQAKEALAENERARNAQMTSELSRRWDEKQFRDVRRAVAGYEGREGLRDALKQLREQKSEDYWWLLTEPSYLEDIAVSVNHDILDFGIVKDSLGYIVCYRWHRWELAVLYLRDARGEPSCYEHFEALAARMRQELGLPDDWGGEKD